MAFKIETLTAKLYPKGSAQYAGTAWLCSREYVLTAAHCVVDRESPQRELGPFRLVFPWGQLECATHWWNFDSDAALLRVTAGETEKIPDQIEAIRSWLETPQSLDENERTWSAYGFPAAKPSGMIIDGEINLINGNIYGTVDNYPAIQLTTKQGGAKPISVINPRTGKPQKVMILGGVSGSAVMYRERILGLVRWGPPELGQKVIYATSLSNIATQCPEVASVLAEHQRNYLRENLNRWSGYEGAIRRRLNEEELDDHLDEVAIDSPLMENWNNFIRQRGWHEDIGNHLRLIRDKAAQYTREFDWLVQRLDSVDCTVRYEKIVQSLKKLLSPSTFNKLREIELKFKRRLKRAQKNGPSTEIAFLENVVRVAGELDSELNALKRTISPPLFRRCFLVTGSRGAGKSHFLTSLLNTSTANSAASAQKDEDKGRGYLLLPLGPSLGGEQLEEAILDEVEKASAHRWRSLDEVNKFIDDISTATSPNPQHTELVDEFVKIKSGPFANFKGKVEEVDSDTSTLKAAITLFGRTMVHVFHFSEVEKPTIIRRRGRDLKLIIAIDNLEQLIERQPGFDDRLSQFIANHTHLSHIYWLITLHDASYDKVSKNSLWRRYSNVYPITDASPQKKNYQPNIDGWLALDEFNLSKRFGLSIIQAVQQKEGMDETGPAIRVEALEAYDEGSPTVRYLSNPFLAWITLDIVRDFEENVLDLRFIEFIDYFWEKRYRSLNPEPQMSKIELAQAIELTARVLPAFPNHSTSLPGLLDELTRQAGVYNYELKRRELAQSAVDILLRNNLLRKPVASQSFTTGFSKPEIIEMGLEIFWEYYIAIEFQKDFGGLTASHGEEARTIWQKLQGMGSKGEVAEGVAIFLLLLLDKKNSDDESYDGLITELLRQAVDSSGPLAAAVWFAGAKISPATQRLLLQVSLEQRQQGFLQDRRTLFAYLSFVGEASTDVLDAQTRLALLQPHYGAIQEAALAPYFFFIVARLFRTIDDAETILSCMLNLTGCEVLRRTRGLAALTFDRLDKILQDEEDPQSMALDVVIRYLQSLSRSGVAALDKPHQGNEPYYFRENILNELCRRLVYRQQLDAYDLLAEHNWYKPELLQIEEPLAQEMQQQSNIALGAWYRHQIIGKKRYLKLITQLMEGELADRVIAFYLIRHTISMRGPQTVRVDHRFKPALEKIFRDPQMQEIVNKYQALFAINLPSELLSPETLREEPL
jgi:hypothetical protein